MRHSGRMVENRAYSLFMSIGFALCLLTSHAQRVVSPHSSALRMRKAERLILGMIVWSKLCIWAR
jgi:hypothetical protein